MVSRIFRAPPLGRLRLASIEDSPMIMSLINESMAKNFRIKRQSDLDYLIENSVLTICQLDINDVLVGFLSAREYPLVPCVHPQAWEEYIWTKYKSVELNSRNTLFLHMLCWNPIYSRDVVDSMLKSIFMHDPYVQYIGIVKSLVNYPLLVPGQSRSEASFRRVQASERGVPGDLLPALCIVDRTEVSPRLRIRRAVEEDNDDIVPIIERQSVKLREMYGEFYISELISRHPESERVLLVCESKEVAVGVMCLNNQINYEALEENFEISPFAGLRRMTKPYKKEGKDMTDPSVSYTASQINSIGDNGISNNSESMVRAKDAKSRVTWMYDEEEFKSFHEDSTLPTPPAHLPFRNSLPAEFLNLFEEEEELEFDIINIDTELLRVPKLLSNNDIVQNEENKKIFLEENRLSSDDKLKKDTLKGAANKVTKTWEYPRYSGPPNAFLMELFAMHQDYDERYGFDLLEAAFDLFPDRDYCIICLPSSHVSFPLLEHFTLVTPYSSKLRFINETLFVAHVNSVRGDIKVRAAEAFDISHMSASDVLEHAPRAQALMDLFETSLTSHSLRGYVFLSQNQPVGLVVLGPLENGTVLRTHFDLDPEPRRPGTDGAVLAGVMSPVMEPHSRWFMRELLRQSHYSTIFWMCRLFAKGDSSPSRNLMSLAGHMTPVHPRRTVPNMSGNKDLDHLYNDSSSPFALWVLERPLSSLPKIYVNNSIVVVGSSRTGLAFLEMLLLGPTSQYMTFSNVTLVSEHGLPTVTECLKAADTCIPKDGRYTDRYLKMVPFYFYVDVMSAVMVGIDRKTKCIKLKCGGLKYYDELVLTCGQQFQHPEYLHDPLELVKEVELGKPCDRMLMDNPEYQPDYVPLPPDLPDNVMVVNSLFQANICLRQLLYMISEYKDTPVCLSEDNPVVVYGDCIEAYCCISALLELGLDAETILFVEPFPSEDPAKLRVNCFNNETVDERVQTNWETLGIRVFRKNYLAGWRQRMTHVEALNLMSPLQAIYQPCFALFYYGFKAVDIYAFKSINECGLVYDGGLVVGPSFETNDPHVFAAGTCTKYSRRLHANRLAHGHYSSEDVGEALAKLFLRRLDPFVMANTDADPEELTRRFSSTLFSGSHASISSATRLSMGTSGVRWQPVMKFESPIVQSAKLPGPLYYMKLRKPGIEIPMEVQMSLPHQGHILITNKRGNYFRLQLNVLHCVSSVTCLSKKPFSSEVLSQLYGKHEAFFDKLLTRFQMNLIEDLYDFFMQPWMSALYQETFANLLRDINDQNVGTVYDLIKSKFSLNDDERLAVAKSNNMSQMSTTSIIPECGYGPKDANKLGTFRSVVDRFVTRLSTTEIVKASRCTDIPSECGQSAAIRGEATSFWQTVGGDRIVIAHLARYLKRNNVTNPHFAAATSDFS